MSETFDKTKFSSIAGQWRYVITDMICRAGSGHIGGALSLVDIMVSLYNRDMSIDPKNPDWPNRDRLVLSKGHAAPVMYCALGHMGFFPKSWLKTMNDDGTRLPSHSDGRTVPGIDATTGSLGQGLSVACGMALAGKRAGKKHTVFCIIGDGETNEGQNWEAGMFAAHNNLDNLVAITDYNKMQIDGTVKDILDLEPLADKWRAFGWEVFEMDGHDFDEIHSAVTKAKETQGKPAMIIAHTIKGKGCSIVEGTVGSHNVKVPDEETWKKFLASMDVTDVTLPY